MLSGTLQNVCSVVVFCLRLCLRLLRPDLVFMRPVVLVVVVVVAFFSVGVTLSTFFLSVCRRLDARRRFFRLLLVRPVVGTAVNCRRKPLPWPLASDTNVSQRRRSAAVPFTSNHHFTALSDNGNKSTAYTNVRFYLQDGSKNVNV